jgi:hypothetical protein
VAFFALGAVGLASAAHKAGGEDLSPVAVMLAVPTVMVVINMLASARRGRLSLLLAMGLTQIALHVVFMAASISAMCPRISGRLMGGEMSAGLMGVPAMPMAHTHSMLSCSASMTNGVTGGWPWPSMIMLLGHLLAMVVLVLVLAGGESAVWALAGWLGFRILRTSGVVRLPAAGRLPAPIETAFRPRSTVPRRSVRRRGPPRPALAVH